MTAGKGENDIEQLLVGVPAKAEPVAPDRGGLYTASVVTKIVSVIVCTVCITLVACMINDEMEDVLDPASNITGGLTILLDVVSWVLMARASPCSKKDKKFIWVKIVSKILFVATVGYGLVLLFGDLDVGPGLIVVYMVVAAISWSLMLAFVELQRAKSAD